MFWGKIGQTNQNCPFQIKFGIETNLIMLNSIAMLTFYFKLDGDVYLSCFEQKIVFSNKFSPKY